MTKTELRRQFLQQRKGLTPDDVNQRSELIAGRFFDFLEDKSLVGISVMIHTFLPIQRQNEVNTWLLIRKIWAQYGTMNVAVPVTNASKSTLSHYRLLPQTSLLENRWGIPEPAGTDLQPQQPTDFDFVLIPLLAFGRQGQRIGYGGGFYDRFLAECRPDCLKIGLSLFDPVDCIANSEPTDVRLDACITPNHIWFF